MSQEALEAKLVQKTVAALRMAQHVIEKLHEGKEKGFQEEPSLSDLVLVAQIIGQTSTMDRLGEMGLPKGVDQPAHQPLGEATSAPLTLPDLFLLWTPEGWYVNVHPDLQCEPQCCRSLEELWAVLQHMVPVVAQHRLQSPQEPA